MQVRRRGGLAAVLLVAVTMVLGTGSAPARLTSEVSVIVQADPGAVDRAARAIEEAGGTVGRRLDIIAGFAADLPTGALGRIERAAGVAAVVPDGSLHLMQDGTGGADGPGSSTVPLTSALDAIGAPAYTSRGWTGRGVDVALIDSGVAPVEGLTAPGKVVNGPDLSFESRDDPRRHVDTFGHGTHLAGIIAGRDGDTGFLGVAPDARLVSVKVADATGAADVSQVIAAIDWVVRHRHDNDLDIRVLALAFGTDGARDGRLDPLADAAAVAWRHGIVVVVAAGNDGRHVGPLRDPATDPLVLAVGADDTRDTPVTSDDAVPPFSNRGDGLRDPDVVAPGVSLVSLRAPGSTAERMHPDALVGDRFIRGSGTSQATAMVAGAAALVVQQRPDATADQVKALLKSTARRLNGFGPKSQGSGVVALDIALSAPTPQGSQAWETGGFWNGSPWDAGEWAGSTWSGSSWSGSSWSGSSWSAIWG